MSDAAGKPADPKRPAFNAAYLLTAFFAAVLFHSLWTQQRRVEILPYSEFQSLLKMEAEPE